MTRHAILLISLWLPVAATAAPSTEAQREIAHLLSHVGKSGCQFYRNGSWYDAATARKHMEQKYRYLLPKEVIESSGDFIRLAASRSSMSSKPYLVRCGNAKPVESKQWMFDELMRYRHPDKSP